jgi:hypothetical protein
MLQALVAVVHRADMRNLVLFLTLSVAIFAGVMMYLLSMLSLSQLIICSTEGDAFAMPAGACQVYLQLATDAEDAAELSASGGLSYAFEIEDKKIRYDVLNRLTTLGIDVNSISSVDGLTPLNAAILLNDAELVGYLLNKGADPDRADSANNLDAHQYLQFLIRNDRSMDRDEVAEILR